MADIDKAVELARTVVGANAKLEGVAADIAIDLARAVLAMAPVVEAARKQVKAADVYATSENEEAWNDDAFLTWQAKCEATESAIRTLDAEARRG